MRTKILLKRELLIVVPLGFILFAALLLHSYKENPNHSSSSLLIENVTAGSNQEPASTGLPMRLKIPGIGVDSAIIPVGLTKDGAMDVPKGPDEVAWFQLGPRPGEKGNAVMAGHYDWIKNLPAVFDYLHTLQIGDKISVEDEKGFATTFVVREIRIFGKDDGASEVFRSRDGKAHLNLITCTGTWNKKTQTFSNRLVVFTDKE